jgi:hypothetical protein
MRRRGAWPALAALALVALTACSPVPQDGIGPTEDAIPARNGSCGLGLPDTAGDQEAITALLRAESAYVVQQDSEALLRLWAPDGRIADAKHTPADPGDDQTWEGTDAIRHRYLRRVFPGNPSAAQPADLTIALDGDRATVTGTTRIGNEVSLNGDRWQVAKIEGCWVIKELVFDLEPHQ